MRRRRLTGILLAALWAVRAAAFGATPAKPAAPLPGRQNAYLTSMGYWKAQVGAGKGDPKAFDLLSRALGGSGPTQQQLIKQAYWRSHGVGDVWGKLLAAILLSDPGLLRQDMGRWIKGAAQDAKMALPLALARHALGSSLLGKEPAQSEKLFTQSLATLQKSPYRIEAAMVQGDMALALYYQGQLARGDQWLAKTRTAYQKAGGVMPGRLWEAGARVSLRRENHRQALDRLAQALLSYNRERDRLGVLRVLPVQGTTLARTGQGAKGVKVLEQALRLTRGIYPPCSVEEADLLVRRATVRETLGQAAVAHKDYLAALKCYSAQGHREGEKRALWSGAQTALETRQHKRAAELFGKLVGRFPDTGALYRVRLGLAQSLALSGQCKEGLVQVEKAQALQKNEKNGDLGSLLLLRAVRGRCYKALGRLQEAADELGQALEMADLMKLPNIAGEIKKLQPGLPKPAKSLFNLTPTPALSGSVAVSGSGAASASTGLSPSSPPAESSGL